MASKKRQAGDLGRGGATGVGTATEASDEDKQSRVGKYGGDDGALEHDTTEINPPADTGSKVKPGRKQGA